MLQDLTKWNSKWISVNRVVRRNEFDAKPEGKTWKTWKTVEWSQNDLNCSCQTHFARWPKAVENAGDMTHSVLHPNIKTFTLTGDTKSNLHHHIWSSDAMRCPCSELQIPMLPARAMYLKHIEKILHKRLQTKMAKKIFQIKLLCTLKDYLKDCKKIWQKKSVELNFWDFWIFAQVVSAKLPSFSVHGVVGTCIVHVFL